MNDAREQTQAMQLASPQQILMAGLLAGPIAGFWLLISNYRVYRNRRVLLLAATVGVLVTLGLVTLILKAPTDTPDWLFWLMTTALLASWLRFGPTFTLDGGSVKYGGWGRPIGVTSVTIAWSFPFLFAAIILLPSQPINTHVSRDTYVYYEGYATRGDAIDLVTELRRQGVINRYDNWVITLRFPTDNAASVELEVYAPFSETETAQRIANAFKPVIKQLQTDLYTPRAVSLRVTGFLFERTLAETAT
ncbi:MAG: hypothetical protein AAFU66_01340 [Pseudomonadota bacterium]